MTTSLKDKRADAIPGSNGAVANGQARGLANEAIDMTEISPRLVAYNFAYLALVWAVALGAIALFWAFPAWYTFIFAFIVVSSRQQALLNVEHECIHGKLVPSKKWNERIGRYLCAGPLGSPFSASRNRHLTHHRLLGTDEDPDLELHAGPDKETRGGLMRHFLSGLFGAYAGMVLLGPPRGDNKTPRGVTGSTHKDIASLVIGHGVLFAGLWLTTAWWVYPALWIAPLATVTVLGHLLRSFAEHAISKDEMAEHSNRLITIHSNWVERFLLSPYGMNYHAEHHLLPSVPAPRLRKLQRRLADRPDKPAVLERRSYSEALRRYVGKLAG